MSTAMFGARVQRLADQKLVRGEGQYIDDIPLHDALHVAFVRSPFARAKIVSINCDTAKTMDGVVAIYTCEDLQHLDIEMPLLIPHPSLTEARTQRPLARDEVFYVGQTIVMVVASTRYAAEDATRMVEIDYDPLDVELDIEKAVVNGLSLIHI